MKKTLTLFAVAASLLGASAFATPINNGAGLASPAVTLTFDEIVLQNSTTMGTQYASLGLANITGLYFNGCENACVTTPGGSHPELSNFAHADFGAFSTSSSLVFGANQNAASFQFASNGGPYSLTALLDGQTVESFAFNGISWGIYGFQNIVFDEIRISSSSAFLLDNLQLSNASTDVPEPASLSLLAIAAAGLGFSRRRKAA